ncbi:MAG: hypothetical protein O7C01_06380 [Actinobacteria bacterium]|nr:hypothetical protein [Actinomycetota bacterium]
MTQTDSAATTDSLLPEQVAWNNDALIDDCASGVQWSAGQSTWHWDSCPHRYEPHRIDH